MTWANEVSGGNAGGRRPFCFSVSAAARTAHFCTGLAHLSRWAESHPQIWNTPPTKTTHGLVSDVRVILDITKTAGFKC